MIISLEERKVGRLNPSSLEVAHRQLRELGYVVLESVFEPEWITDLLNQYLTVAKRQHGKQWPDNHGGINHHSNHGIICSPFSYKST